MDAWTPRTVVTTPSASAAGVSTEAPRSRTGGAQLWHLAGEPCRVHHGLHLLGLQASDV